MKDVALNVEIHEALRQEQDVDGFRLTTNELLSLLSMYDPYGVWRLDLETGLVNWSRDVFEIHGMEYKKGPVDLKSALNAYHPDDALVIGQLIEETIEKKSGFRFVLRLKSGNGGYKLVKSSGKYRINDDGKEQLVGLFSQFAPAIRSIATSE